MTAAGGIARAVGAGPIAPAARLRTGTVALIAARAGLFSLPAGTRAGLVGAAAGRMIGFDLVAAGMPVSPVPCWFALEAPVSEGVWEPPAPTPACGDFWPPPSLPPPDSSPASAPLESDCFLLLLGDLGCSPVSRGLFSTPSAFLSRRPFC